MMNADTQRQRVHYLLVAADSIAHCWRAHPLLFMGLILTSTLLCAVQVGEVFAMRHLFDIVAMYIAGTVTLHDVVMAVVPMATLLIAFPFINIAAYLTQGYFWRRGSGYLMSQYHACVQRIPLIDFEKTDTFDRMHKAQIGSEEAPAAGRSIIQFAFYYIPYLVFTALFLVSIKPILLVALLIIFASVMLAQVLRAGVMRRFTDENAGLRRQMDYLESCITGKEYAKETRTLGATGYFFRLFVDAMKRFHHTSMKTERKVAGIELLLRAVNVLGYAAILCLLLYYVMDGSISVGAFASVFYAIERINDLLRRMVNDFGELLKAIGTASFMYTLLHAPKETGSTQPLEKSTDISLTHVTFAYPSGESNVLHDITLTIKQGETLAIVGENGAGKTTLTKVIMGLYNPSSGAVYYGSEDMNRYAAKSRFHRISSVFQNFIRYKLTAQKTLPSAMSLPDMLSMWQPTAQAQTWCFCHKAPTPCFPASLTVRNYPAASGNASQSLGGCIAHMT